MFRESFSYNNYMCASPALAGGFFTTSAIWKVLQLILNLALPSYPVLYWLVLYIYLIFINDIMCSNSPKVIFKN